MAYKQDGFLNGLLTNFRKRKDFKIDAMETSGAYNPESNTVNVKEGNNVIEMPMRKYTKKALSSTPNPVVTIRESKAYSHGDQRVGNIGFDMEFSEQPTFSKPKKNNSKKQKAKTPNSKYSIGKSGKQKVHKDWRPKRN